MTEPRVVVRAASEADVDAISTIWIRSWQWAYRGILGDAFLDALSLPERARERREAFSDAVSRGDREVRVVERDGMVAGWAIGGSNREPFSPEDEGEIYAINLDPDAVGKGLGRALFAEAVDGLRNAGFREAILWVPTENRRARRFYEIAGWRPDGTTRTDRWLDQDFAETRYRFTLRTESP
jgi:ribosomal protein S18 acetylase RimI-like enzyme